MINNAGGGGIGPINSRLLLLHQLLGGLGGGGYQPGIHSFGPPGGQVPGQPPPGYAQILHGLGADNQGASLWESRHPGAMGTPEQPGTGNIPGWVLAAQTQSIGDAAGGPGAAHQAHVGNAQDIIQRLVQQIAGGRQARQAPPPSLRRGRGMRGTPNPGFDY